MKDQIDTASQMGPAMLMIIGAMAELEAALISERVTARVVEMKTRITLPLPSACPAAPIMRMLLERLPRMAPV